MVGVTFADADFHATGVQNGFNDKITNKGMPHDAAIAVSNSSHVSFTNCSFLALGGTGVVIGNRSTHVIVSGSTFVQMGQSGVLFVGNDTTQARECAVLENSMKGLGTILVIIPLPPCICLSVALHDIE